MAARFLPLLLVLAASLFASSSLGQQFGAEVGSGKDDSPPPPPPFLQGEPQEKINEFLQLLNSSGQKTDKQIEEMVKEWIGKQSADIKTKFSAFEDEKEKMLAAQEAEHQKALSNFSPEAKAADAKLTEIAKDSDLSAQDKAKKIQQFVDSLEPKVRDEIEKALQG